MSRNKELIRQWEVLRDIDGARNGISAPKLAAARGVHQRTIKRDLEALCRAGFPLYDDRANGTPMWRIGGRPFRAIEDSGLGVTEIAALYFSRSICDTLAGAPFDDDLTRAFFKIEKALPAGCRSFLDRLPRILKAKPRARKKAMTRRTREILDRALDATTRRRLVTMRYASASSRRTKIYVVEPQRISYADGGLYLTAWVPEYDQMRNFAVERIETLAVGDEQFEPRALPHEPFANSMGAFSGPPERVEIAFDAATAPYVREREWHKTQHITEREDGSLVLQLDVCNDRPLRAWILGFGAGARVVAPTSLAREVARELGVARAQYRSALAMGADRETGAQGTGPQGTRGHGAGQQAHGATGNRGTVSAA
jgi:predicted DNA-binding transcriptional regulator YafY